MIGGVNRVVECLIEGGIAIPDRAAFVTLVRTANDRWSGFDSQNGLIGATALNLLDQQIKHHETGLPVEPLTILVPPRWEEGADHAPTKSKLAIRNKTVTKGF